MTAVRGGRKAKAQATADAPSAASWLAQVNAYRALAGVPPVSEDTTLDAQCFEHARYMAENNDLTHEQNRGDEQRWKIAVLDTEEAR